MDDFLSKARPGRSVLQRTRERPGLPKFLLYTAWLRGEMKRRLLDVDGAVHDLPDGVVKSHYKLVPGKDTQALLEAHWPTALQTAP